MVDKIFYVALDSNIIKIDEYFLHKYNASISKTYVYRKQNMYSLHK